MGLLAICLLLLVATVALGACCELWGWVLLGLGVVGQHGERGAAGLGQVPWVRGGGV